MDNKIEVNFRIKIRGIIPDNIEKLCIILGVNLMGIIHYLQL